MKPIHWLIVLMSNLVFLPGCGLDLDEEFYPETQAVYLLYRNSFEDLKLGAFDRQNQFWQPDFLNQLGASQGLSDISGNDTDLWLAFADSSQIWLVRDGLVADKIDLPLQPHALQLGTDQLVVADTLRGLAGIWDLRLSSLDTLAVPGLRAEIAYRSQKFYLAADSLVVIVDGRLSREINRVSLDRQVREMHIDNGVYTRILSGDSLLSEALIDWNTNRLARDFIEINRWKIRYSPYAYSPFGKENTRFFALSGQALQPGAIPRIMDFEPDFFENEVYVVSDDSLGVYSPRENALRMLTPFKGRLLKAQFRRAAEGK